MDANQSRRRTDLGPDSVSDTRPKIDNEVVYHGKALHEDRIRLVEIQPAANEIEPIVCTLSDVPFSSRPKFEALSYMWGDQRADEVITLNGVPFEVRKNLLNALFFLRGRRPFGQTRQPFWIDAICINQSDIEERTRQVRIMHHIYFRAGTVVVWLGSTYTDFQGIRSVQSGGGEKGEQKSFQSSDDSQQKVVRLLRSDKYWNRLWILQEIGQADKLRVCFGNNSCSWEAFMQLMAMHNSDGMTGPLRLDRLLRQEKYNDSHTLKRLLEEHREAECSEPRDKVYGLVGLASDAAGFPVDYSKSLYEVWKDTMVFMNKWGLFKGESQIIMTGALVKSLLMASHWDPFSQISTGHEDRVDPTKLIDSPKSPLVFHLKAVALGCIVYVGPSASDLISEPGWTSTLGKVIQELFPGNDLGPTRRECDRLHRALLESDESEVEMMCFNRPSTVVWTERISDHLRASPITTEGYIRLVTGVATASTTSQTSQPQATQQSTNRLASVQPRVYLAKGRGGKSALGKMGVASGLVQPRDLVCWVRSSRRAILVRVVEKDQWDSRVRVFGTALATEDMRGPEPDLAERSKSLERGWNVEVQLDAETIFMLLA